MDTMEDGRLIVPRAAFLRVSLAVLAFFPLGCSSLPLGLTKPEWEALTSSQQAEYRLKQAEIDERDRARDGALRLAREQTEREAATREADRVMALRANARWGDVITVSVAGGMVAFNGKRYPYEPVAFDIVKGETKGVLFSRQGQPTTTTEVVMFFSEDGNTFHFDAPAPKRFVALRDSTWSGGARYPIPEIGSHDGRSEAIGVTITIRFKDLPRRPAGDRGNESR